MFVCLQKDAKQRCYVTKLGCVLSAHRKTHTLSIIDLCDVTALFSVSFGDKQTSKSHETVAAYYGFHTVALGTLTGYSRI